MLFVSRLYSVDMINECVATGGIKTGRRSRSTRRKPTPVEFRSPEITHDLTQYRTRTTAVRSRRLTAWAMVEPILILLFPPIHRAKFIQYLTLKKLAGLPSFESRLQSWLIPLAVRTRRHATPAPGQGQTVSLKSEGTRSPPPPPIRTHASHVFRSMFRSDLLNWQRALYPATLWTCSWFTYL
jgi:hypothetical protein